VKGLEILLTPLRRLIGGLRTTRRTLVAVPDLVDAVLVLPTLSRQVEAVAFATATLPEMHAEIMRVHGDTTALPTMDESLSRIADLVAQVDENTKAVHQLADVAMPLQGAVERVARFADRIPQRRVSPEARRADATRADSGLPRGGAASYGRSPGS
jgi:hypothetical protein